MQYDQETEAACVFHTAIHIASQKGIAQAANTAMFGGLMQAGNLGLPKEAYGNAFQAMYAKNSTLINLNQEILEAGAQAVRYWRWWQRSEDL